MDDNTLLRYSRQIFLPQVELAGQTQLLASRVLVVGLGGLGSPAAMYLAAAGVGTLVINDFDTVDLSNLQRQIVHGTADVGRAKTASAADGLTRLNPDVRIETIASRLEGWSLAEAIAGVDVVLDCSDNFATRFAVNAACVAAAKPLVSGAAIRFEAQLIVFDPRQPDSPCYNCIYPDQGELEEGCARNGVIAPLPGVIGSLQALEAIKLLLGSGSSSTGQLLVFDALNLDWQRLRIKKNPHCPTCGAA